MHYRIVVFTPSFVRNLNARSKSVVKARAHGGDGVLMSLLWAYLHPLCKWRSKTLLAIANHSKFTHSQKMSRKNAKGGDSCCTKFCLSIRVRILWDTTTSATILCLMYEGHESQKNCMGILDFITYMEKIFEQIVSGDNHQVLFCTVRVIPLRQSPKALAQTLSVITSQVINIQQLEV